jgi:hypothetical protein
MLPRSFLEQYEYELGFIVLQIREEEMASSAVERLKSKALQAKGVVPRILTAVEADLDQVIAAEPELERQKDAAFAPHFAAIADTKTELAGIADALNIMSNGGPPLDPLPGSEPAAVGSNPASTQIPGTLLTK